MSLDTRSVMSVVGDSSQVSEARRAAVRLAAETGLGEEATGKVAIVATELAGNLARHAGGGEILVRRVERDGACGVEVMAVDKGPGMADREKCFRDGYSSIGTSGIGLGSVTRLADRWDVYTMPGQGTVLAAQITRKMRERAASRLEVGAVTTAMKGDEFCGDNWAHSWNASLERFLAVDGLGHGEFAAEAADEARRVFHEKEGCPLLEMMQAIHNALRKTRGAAVAIAELDLEKGLARYVGVGNISSCIVHNEATRSLVSQNGIVGHDIRKLQEFQFPWHQGALLVMNSDGLHSRWDLRKYPGLQMRHPSVIAGVLWRDFTRGRDDAMAVVAKERV